MRKLFVLLLIGVGVFLSGCNLIKSFVTNDEHEGTEAIQESADDHVDEEEVEIDKPEEEPVTADGSSLGDLDVRITGEATVAEDKIIIEGESNLLPGTTVWSGGTTIHNFASSTFIDSTTVEEDGSFYFEYPGIETSTEVRLTVSTSRDETKEHYGEHLEKATGPQVYMTDTHGEFQIKAHFFIDVDKEMPYTVPIEVPEWEEKPADFGEPEVWMEVDYETDHQYIYFYGKSNLMEGSHVGGNLRFASGMIEPFSYDFTYVNPDGTFELKVRYHTLKKGMYMPIAFEPVKNSWEDVLTAYGEKGEKLLGDLVIEEEDEKYVEYIVELDAPDYDPPEDVGLTVEEDEVKIQMPDDLLFDFDESTLKEEAKKTLDQVIKDLEKLTGGTELEINGHTDDVGDPDYNLNLSLERAEAVWEYLQKHGEVAEFDIVVDGYGDQKPIASNEDSEGQSKNRRVEIVINPK